MRNFSYDEEAYRDHEDHIRKRKRLSRWTEVPFGVHEGLTLPEIFFTDLSYFFWFIGREFKSPQLAEEAKTIARKAACICVPIKCRETHRFALIVDQDGVFSSVKIIKAGTRNRVRLPPGLKIRSVRRLLDARVPAKLRNSELGYARMQLQLRELLLDCSRGRPSADTCDNFFTKAVNFGVHDEFLRSMGLLRVARGNRMSEIVLARNGRKE